MKVDGQFPSSLIQFPNNLLTPVLYEICFWVPCRVASFIICPKHRSHSSPSLFIRGTLVQNLSQSETPQFVFHTDMWHLVTHVNYNYRCHTELFRRLERFRPTKHKHWGCMCLLYSSKHSAQQFSNILAYHTRIILARCITLHVKQAPNLTANVLSSVVTQCLQSCVLTTRVTRRLTFWYRNNFFKFYHTLYIKCE